VHDGDLYLSTFDGAHAFLYKAKISGPDAALTGDYWSGTSYHERWSAKRDAHAALPDAYSLTNLRSGVKGFEFAFPDLAGNPVTSKDARFRNKVLVVALAGSWCPNCHDEAAFLAPFYREYRAKGVEIVSLMFEHFGDFDRAAAATERFRQHYGIEYTTLIAGISDKDEAAKSCPCWTGFTPFRRRFSSTARAGSARFTRAIQVRPPANTTRNSSMNSKAPSINYWRRPDWRRFPNQRGSRRILIQALNHAFIRRRIRNRYS